MDLKKSSHQIFIFDFDFTSESTLLSMNILTKKQINKNVSLQSLIEA